MFSFISNNCLWNQSDNAIVSETNNIEKTQNIIANNNSIVSGLIEDNSVGLLTTKINQGIELTEEQKKIIQYFDNDYFSVADYEFLQRYPQVFQGSQIRCVAQIQKVLSYTGEDYQALAFIYDTVSGMENNGAYFEDYTNENYIVVNGKQSGLERIIEGDVIQIYGRYTNVDTYNIDGYSYTIPSIDLYDTTYINDDSRFSYSFIKSVAKAIFGANIEVRNAVVGEDYTDSEISWKLGFDPYVICELENQTNSKFTKFRFYTERGQIDDAKAASSNPMLDLFTTNIIRKMEFAPDLQHFLVYTYYTDFNTLSLDYYDTNFNKIWNREFSETENAVYDYTEKIMYLVANNDYYAISLEDGSDLIKPIFVGKKDRILKTEDGIILISNSTSDTVMKINRDGQILWKTNTNLAAENLGSIQRLNNHIIIELSSGWNYIIVDENDGTLIGEIDG